MGPWIVTKLLKQKSDVESDDIVEKRLIILINADIGKPTKA